MKGRILPVSLLGLQVNDVVASPNTLLLWMLNLVQSFGVFQSHCVEVDGLLNCCDWPFSCYKMFVAELHRHETEFMGDYLSTKIIKSQLLQVFSAFLRAEKSGGTVAVLRSGASAKCHDPSYHPILDVHSLNLRLPGWAVGKWNCDSKFHSCQLGRGWHLRSKSRKLGMFFRDLSQKLKIT